MDRGQFYRLVPPPLPSDSIQMAQVGKAETYRQNIFLARKAELFTTQGEGDGR